MKLSTISTRRRYILIYPRNLWYYLSMYSDKSGMRTTNWYAYNICVNSLRRISYIRNDRYKWTQVDTINGLIVNVFLCNILHIGNVDICGTQHEILKLRLYAINTVSAYEYSWRNKCWMYGYKESEHSIHFWINFYAPKHDTTGKGEMYENQMVSAIILIPRFTNEKTLYSWLRNNSSFSNF